MMRMSSSRSYRSFITAPPSWIEGDDYRKIPFASIHNAEDMSVGNPSLHYGPSAARGVRHGHIGITNRILDGLRRNTHAVSREQFELVSRVASVPDLDRFTGHVEMRYSGSTAVLLGAPLVAP